METISSIQLWLCIHNKAKEHLRRLFRRISQLIWIFINMWEIIYYVNGFIIFHGYWVWWAICVEWAPHVCNDIFNIWEGNMTAVLMLYCIWQMSVRNNQSVQIRNLSSISFILQRPLHAITVIHRENNSIFILVVRALNVSEKHD